MGNNNNKTALTIRDCKSLGITISPLLPTQLNYLEYVFRAWSLLRSRSWGFASILAALLVFTFTYLITLLQWKIALGRPGATKKPPTLPYWVPLLGHIVPFIWDPAGLVTSIVQRIGTSIPVRLRLFNTELYLISGTQNLRIVWKKSQHLSSKVQVLIGVGTLFGTSKDALEFYETDNSGVHPIPHSGTKVQPENRIHYLTHKTVTQLLAGKYLLSLAQSFQSILENRISNLEVTSGWTDMPDLLSFLQAHMFAAAVEGMCGPYLLALNPDFSEDFWSFDRYMPYILKGYPRILKPTAWRARDNCLKSVKKWHTFVKHHDDDTTQMANAQDPHYGTALMRARQDYFSKMRPMTADAIASADLGLIWATNSNTIPAAFWMIAEVVRDIDLLFRVRNDLSTCVSGFSQSGSPNFDIPKLCNRPLLQSIYTEVLRLYTSVMIVRSAEHTNVTVEDWNFPKNSLITISSRVAHMDKEVWSTGHENLHPPNEFWAERFLVFSHDPSSGPFVDRFRNVRPYASKNNLFPEEPKFSFGGAAGAWIPYGGGDKMCPGRHFAKQEILLTFATLCSAFDIELRTDVKSGPYPDLKFYGLGVLPPRGKIPFRIRRRELFEALGKGPKN